MNNLASLVIDLLSTLTFQPESGLDPDAVAAVEQTAWQTLIHDLSPNELAAVRESAQRMIENFASRADSLPGHLQSQAVVWQQFVDGELS
jgi:hypothetical protein